MLPVSGSSGSSQFAGSRAAVGAGDCISMPRDRATSSSSTGVCWQYDLYPPIYPYGIDHRQMLLTNSSGRQQRRSYDNSSTSSLAISEGGERVNFSHGNDNCRLGSLTTTNIPEQLSLNRTSTPNVVHDIDNTQFSYNISSGASALPSRDYTSTSDTPTRVVLTSDDDSCECVVLSPSANADAVHHDVSCSKFDLGEYSTSVLDDDDTVVRNLTVSGAGAEGSITGGHEARRSRASNYENVNTRDTTASPSQVYPHFNLEAVGLISGTSTPRKRDNAPSIANSSNRRSVVSSDSRIAADSNLRLRAQNSGQSEPSTSFFLRNDLTEPLLDYEHKMPMTSMKTVPLVKTSTSLTAPLVESDVSAGALGEASAIAASSSSVAFSRLSSSKWYHDSGFDSSGDNYADTTIGSDVFNQSSYGCSKNYYPFGDFDHLRHHLRSCWSAGDDVTLAASLLGTSVEDILQANKTTSAATDPSPVPSDISADDASHPVPNIRNNNNNNNNNSSSVCDCCKKYCLLEPSNVGCTATTNSDCSTNTSSSQTRGHSSGCLDNLIDRGYWNTAPCTSPTRSFVHFDGQDYGFANPASRVPKEVSTILQTSASSMHSSSCSNELHKQTSSRDQCESTGIASLNIISPSLSQFSRDTNGNDSALQSGVYSLNAANRNPVFDPVDQACATIDNTNTRSHSDSEYYEDTNANNSVSLQSTSINALPSISSASVSTSSRCNVSSASQQDSDVATLGSSIIAQNSFVQDFSSPSQHPNSSSAITISKKRYSIPKPLQSSQSDTASSLLPESNVQTSQSPAIGFSPPIIMSVGSLSTPTVTTRQTLRTSTSVLLPSSSTPYPLPRALQYPRISSSHHPFSGALISSSRASPAVVSRSAPAILPISLSLSSLSKGASFYAAAPKCLLISASKIRSQTLPTTTVPSPIIGSTSATSTLMRMRQSRIISSSPPPSSSIFNFTSTTMPWLQPAQSSNSSISSLLRSHLSPAAIDTVSPTTTTTAHALPTDSDTGI